jgi:hypothetical protein
MQNYSNEIPLKLGMVARCVILATWETDREDPRSRLAQANNSWDLISKITRAMAQVVEGLLCEYLLCQCESLSSNPSPTKKPLKIPLYY